MTLTVGVLLFFSTLWQTAAAQTPMTVTVRLVDALSSASNQSGDLFTAALATPLIINDHIVAEKDARIIGQVQEVVSSGRLKRPALLVLRLSTIEVRSRRVPVHTGDLTVRADSHADRNLLIIGGTAAAGAAIGSAAGGGKGAIIGAVAGTGAGTAGAYLTGKREVVLPSETVLTFHVKSVTISPKEITQFRRLPLEPESGESSTGRFSADAQTIVLRRYRYNDDDDDDDQGDDDHEHRFERPRNIEVVFLRGHKVDVLIQWPGRPERLMLSGDDLEDILEPLARHTRMSVEFLRPRVRLKHED
ncbi:MAG: hypothetical protein NVS1B11_34210 [Terriglobales bacterium]